MKKIYFVFLLFFGLGAAAQSINDYKYAIIPAKFNFLKQPDQYGLNTLTKQFMEKEGFIAYLDSEILPEEVIAKSCDKLYVDVIDDSSMLRTKLQVVLKDCRNNIIFTANGDSKQKEFRIAYNQALRQAFKLLSALGYKYSGNDLGEVVTDKTITILKENFDDKAVGTQLNAQPIANGFQLVDTTPKIVLKIYKTSQPGIFIATGEATSGILVNKGGKYFYEYYENSKLISREMDIKF